MITNLRRANNDGGRGRLASFKKILVILAFLVSGATHAAELPKVLILDYVNIDKNSNFEYLGGSITESVRDMLKKKFAFQESSREEWEKIAAENFVFLEDYHTPTASMNLGLLDRQDVVISGGFRVETRKIDQKQVTQTDNSEDQKRGAEGGYATVIRISTSIYDITQKKILTRFEVEGPASSAIFSSIQTVADKAAQEAAVVLPNKEDWQKKGSSVKALPAAVIFSDFTIGLRGGAGIYALGYATDLTADQPFLSLMVRTSLPVIWSRLALQLQLDYNTHRLTPQTANNLGNLGISGTTTNLAPGLYAGILFPLVKNLLLYAKLGGGLILQDTQISGAGISSSISNTIGYVGLGADISYAINNNIAPVLSLQSQLAFEGEVVTTINQISLGINLRL